MILENSLYNITKKFSTLLLLIYSFIIFSELTIILFTSNFNIDFNFGIRIIQFSLQFFFLCIFAIIIYYNNKYFSILLILSFQMFSSIILWSYYFYIVGEPLGFDANDALLYQNALEDSFGKTWIDLINILKKNKRTASLSDWGYPTYRFFIYKLVPNLNAGLFATSVINALVHTISSWYVYKISRKYLSYNLSIIVMAIWGLSATSIHVNTCGLKETVFSLFVVLALYHLIEIEYHNKVKNTLIFLFNISIIWFFRNYLSIFLFLTYLGCYPFRKIFYRFYFVFFIFIFIISFFGTELLSLIIPDLKFVKLGRNMRMIEFFGGDGLIPQIMNFTFAWITPIPKFSENAEFKQIIFSGFAIFKAFYSMFGVYYIFTILKMKKTRMYPLLTFMVCNIVLVIITCNSLDFRFLHPSVFIDLIFIVLGFSDIYKNGFKLIIGKININITSLLIFSIIYIIMIVYNI